MNRFWSKIGLSVIFFIVFSINNAQIQQHLASHQSTQVLNTTRSQLNIEHANQFKTWLTHVSHSLYDLSESFSGFRILNETYHRTLLDEKNASFSWINFTSMIINISQTISEVFHNKTVIVDQLSEQAEKIFSKYEDENNLDSLEDLESYIYYDAKNEEHFCDTQSISEEDSDEIMQTTSTITSSLTTTTTTTKSPIKKHRHAKTHHHHHHTTHKEHQDDEFTDEKIFNLRLKRDTDDVTSASIGLEETQTTTKVPIKKLPCLERTYEEGYPKYLPVNTNQSTIHVPTNVYNRDTAIVHAAKWTEDLNEYFEKNYMNDNELFWQYFCSAHGLYRRYPGALWNVPLLEDFFDCRLQSWYVSAAASTKDVVILLDSSGSMTGLRLEIAKKLVESIMDTLTDNDFFNIITFSNTAQFLMNLDNETMYRNMTQAGYYNKQTFIEKLKYFSNTSNLAKFNDAFELSFKLLLDNSSESCGCNKVIMVITDGSTENDKTLEEIFKLYNANNDVRVFTFMIGRDVTDPREVRWMACVNQGEYYHVATLADVNEFVHEYIPILGRPMALQGVRETRWSNVFIGHLDKELKIAVARPAFKNFFKESKHNHSKAHRNDLLLGVVGVDVPVLKLISKVSPKYQMGVGIYIIMLDNNGYIVFHPSIREEIKKGEFDYKGRSHSVDLNSFEIPVENEDEFERLEHKMIDQETDNQTLKNWKREGLRVIKRDTEYVYTPVYNTPFSVAIASPKSFGRYFIDLPEDKEMEFNRDLKALLPNLKIENVRVQLYNCSYEFVNFLRRIVENRRDYCLIYSFQDHGQVLAIKSDLLLLKKVYEKYDFKIFDKYINLVRSVFYGSFSGMTFYLPVTRYNFLTSNNRTNLTSLTSTTTTTTKSSGLNFTTYRQALNMFTTEYDRHSFSFEKQYYTRAIEFSDFIRTELNNTQPIVIYFLNETSKDSIKNTISATLPVWLNKVPAAVSGVVYDTALFKKHIFEQDMPCGQGLCKNLCSRERRLNVTCYLIDEHGILITTSSNNTVIEKRIGLPFYKLNPWLMKQLEHSGIYDLVIPGTTMKECRKPSVKESSGVILRSFVNAFRYLFKFLSFLFVTAVDAVRQVQTVKHRVDTFNDIIEKQSSCYYFGIYSLNMDKARELNAAELDSWCTSKRYLVGYVSRSNLLMLIVEDEMNLTRCGSIQDKVHLRITRINDTMTRDESELNEIKVNRYRKPPPHCYNKYPNESLLLPCSHANKIYVQFTSLLIVIYLFVYQACLLSYFHLF